MNTIEEFRNKEIIDEVVSIVNVIRGGMLYGKKIDLTNTAEIVVASYYAGKFGVSLNPSKNIFNRDLK